MKWVFKMRIVVRAELETDGERDKQQLHRGGKSKNSYHAHNGDGTVTGEYKEREMIRMIKVTIQKNDCSKL